ncbi:MAG: Type 1 glutamine amidotransferase-like domain-containing protein [Bacteriovoracaceae bacterium]|jgi:dipeptidase E|nr:peptidase S51 [Halobacteriovoraceae bacterium]MDP7319055.1 Type 1 glutamine amidotransferase-like domain-containing protein [Bacteriovoracaceae bacterium]
MKLVFYSGGYAEENFNLDQGLLSLFKKKDLKLTFIPSSSYNSNEDYRDIIQQYRPYGIRKFYKFHVDHPFSEISKKIAFQADIIHLGGGNTFYFLKYLRKTGLLKELKAWVRNGGVLTGVSAGAIIMTKNIETAAFPSFDCDENEDNVKNLAGLQLVDFEFFPHYKNSKRYDQELKNYSKMIQSPVYACPDGSGILLNHNEIRFIGKTFCFVNGHKYLLNK